MMVGQCSVTAVGYGGAACNGIKTALSGTANEAFTEAFSKFVLKQFEELTSPFPLVGDVGKNKFATAHADQGASFTPSGASGVTGGHSLA
jgi:hypothetical protein